MSNLHEVEFGGDVYAAEEEDGTDFLGIAMMYPEDDDKQRPLPDEVPGGLPLISVRVDFNDKFEIDGTDFLECRLALVDETKIGLYFATRDTVAIFEHEHMVVTAVDMLEANNPLSMIVADFCFTEEQAQHLPNTTACVTIPIGEHELDVFSTWIQRHTENDDE